MILNSLNILADTDALYQNNSTKAPCNLKCWSQQDWQKILKN